MKKDLKRYLACFLAIAVMASYSFSPQNLTAFAVGGAEDQAVAAQEETEQTAEPETKATEETKAETEPSTEAETQTEPSQESEEVTEETTEETEATTEETDEYPATSFTKTAGKMTVRINAPEGALPEGATVQVVSVRAADVKDAVEDLIKDGKVIKAVDITFYDKDGNQIEPQKEVSVSFASEKFSDLNKPAVVHINDEGDAETVDGAKVNTNTNKATFESDQFSIYAVIDEGETGEDARLKVVFKNGDTEIATMYVKKADTQSAETLETVLYDPGVGTVPSGASFKGWTTKADYTADDVSSAKSIDGVRSDVTTMFAATGEDAVKEGDTVTYYAMLFKQYTVSYLGDKDASLGTHNVYIPASSSNNSASYTVNMAYTPPDDLHNFAGWKVKSGGDNIAGHTAGKLYENGTVITISGNVVFSVESPEGHWLIFDENGKGGTYNAPHFYKSSEVTRKPVPDNEMSRFGYTFGGWYKDAECTAGNEFSFGNTLSDNTTIYAKWIANTTARYSVIIWKQNVEGTGYDFYKSVEIANAPVGTTPNAVTTSGTGNNAYATVNGTAYRYNSNNTTIKKDFTGFHFKETDQSSKSVATEGNTVVNVYYDRNQITYNFNVYGQSYTPTTSTSNGWYRILNDNGEYVAQYLYYNNGNWYTDRHYTRPYYRDQDLYTGTVYDYYGNSGWTVYKTVTGLYGSTLADNDFEWPTEYDWYTDHNQTQGNGTRITFRDALLPTDTNTIVNGTEDFYARQATTSNRAVYFYKQNADKTGYDLANTVQTSGNGTFSITDKYNGFYASHYTVDGSSEIELGEKDSDGNYETGISYNSALRIYYNRQDFTLSFLNGSYYNTEGSTPTLEETASPTTLKTVDEITYGQSLNSYNKNGADYFIPETPSGYGDYVFDGWYLDDKCTHPCDFTTMPDGGLTVYAKWVKIQYRVFLHPNAEKKNGEKDTTLNWGTESQSMSFRVSNGKKVSVPTGTRTGWEFVGWYTDPNCTEVYNADLFVLNESTVTSEYNKETDYTDTIDKWGYVNDPKSNSDVNRFWITKKLDLYGKWRETLDGADGIGIEYYANGGSNPPSDSNLYLDSANATAGAASRAPAGKVFKHWVVQKWNETTETYDDTTVIVLPGESYEVLKDNAKCVVEEWDGDKIKKATYTVRLRAEYQDPGNATPTHIPWYENDGTKAFHIDTVEGEGSAEDSTLHINEAVNIQAKPTQAQGRDGYTFIGWAKVDMGDSADAVSAFESTASNWTQDSLGEGNLFLFYNENDGKFHLNSKDGKVVTQVAADEATPYQAMFAVWQKDLTITVKKATKDYSGSEQEGYVSERTFNVTGTGSTIDENEYKVEGLVNGDVLTVSGYTASKGTNVGTYTNGSFDGATITIMRGGTDVTNSYNITTKAGDLEITKKKVTITVTGNTDTKTYNGAEQSVTGYQISIPEGINISEEDITFTGTAEAKGTNVKTGEGDDANKYMMGLSENQFGVTSDSYNVSFKVTDGWLKITPVDLTVTITGNNDTKTYTGSEQSVSGYTISIPEGATLTQDEINGPAQAAAIAKGSDVDGGSNADKTYPMGLKASDFSTTNKNYNVTFSVTDGWLKITPADLEVTITGNNNTLTYNGSEQKVTGYTINIPTGATLTEAEINGPAQAAAIARGTDVDGGSNTDKTYPMGLKASDFSTTNTNYNVTFKIEDGWLKITPADLTVNITGNTDTKTYNGSEQKVTGYTISIPTGATLTEAEINGPAQTAAIAKGTNVDGGSNPDKTYPMGLTEDDFSTENKNYNVTFFVTDGWLKITKADVVVTITGHTDTVTYNGQEQSVTGYDIQIPNDVNLTKSEIVGPAQTAAIAKGTNANGGSNTDKSYPMGLSAEDFRTTNTNYTVEFLVVDGWLIINPCEVTVTIEGRQSSVPYDGIEHSVSGYNVIINDGTGTTQPNIYQESDFTFTPPEGATLIDGVITVARTDVGKDEMGLNASQFTNNNSNFTVTFTVWKDSYQEITPIDVEVNIVGNNNTTDYDGDAHTVEGYVATTESTLYDVTKDFSFSGNATATGTNVGTYPMNLTEGQFTNNNPNFGTVTFNITDGYQKIDPIDVTVKIVGANNTTDYDGDAHTVSGFTAKAYIGETETTLYKVTGENKDFTFSGTAEATRTDAGTTNMGLAASQFTNTNTNFGTVTFEVTDGYQTINPIDVTVKIVGNNNTTDYDGQSHTVTGYAAKAYIGEEETTLYKVEGENKDFIFSGNDTATRTDAGTTNMGLAASQFTNTNNNFGTVTFEVTDGYQKINKIDVTVTIIGNNNTTAYDGQEHTVTGYTASANSTLYDVTKDFTFEGNQTAKRTDAGTSYMGLAKEQFTNTNENFGTVTFVVTDGYQKIDPINVTVTIVGANNATNYDGQEHSVSGYTATASTALYDVEHDFTFTGTASAKRTDAGTTNMNLAADQFENTNNNFGTVTFEITDGYQTINPIDVTVTITGHNSTVPYDGAEHIVTGYDVEISNPLYTEADFTFNGTAEAKRTTVGTTNMNLASTQFENKNGNFATVTFNVTDGYQTITAKKEVVVTITGANNTIDYDGKAHTVKGYTVSISDPLYKETDFTFTPAEDATLVDGVIAATRTNAGTTNMGLAESQFANTNENFENVTFNVIDGYQTISPISATVTIVGANNTTDYDGEEHSVSGYTATASTDLYDVEHDFTFTGTDTAARTDAGTTNMGLAADQFTNTNPNFSTVTFNVTDGYQTITPIDVTVTIVGANNTTDYDGAEHSVSGYTATASTDLYDVTKDFTFSGTAAAARTDAGQTDMGLKAEQFANTNANFANVTFNVTDGYQKIDPIDVTVTIVGANNTTDYDGAEHNVSGYTATASTDLYDVENDFTFSGTAAAARTDAGTTNMGLASSQFANTNQNFANVTFNVTDGYQTITPIDVTVTIVGANSTLPYDGTEHSVSGYTATANTDLYDVNANIAFNGTAAAARTDAGQTDMGLNADQFSNKNANFATVTFNVTDGFQKIEPIDVTVTITGHNNTTTYDGEDHTVTGYDVEISNPLYKEADFSFSGNATATQKTVGTAKMNLAAEQFTNKNANFATVTFNVTDGYQTITPVDEIVVTITGHNNTTAYNGQDHTVTGYDVEISNPLYTEADFSFSGTATATQKNAGTAYMGLAEGQFTNNNENFAKVTFNVTDGYQTVTPIDVTVTIVGANNTTDYDGKEHSVSGYTATADNDLYDVENDFTFSGTAEAARTDAGTTNMGLAEGQFTNTNKNFKTVTFNVTDGYQTINPIDVTVTITGHNNTTDYDGEEHSVSGYDVEISNELYKEADISFSGTAAAARTDAGQTDMGLKAEQFTNTNANFANVTFNVTDGYQKINPIDVTVTIKGHNNTTDYDGAEHSVNGYDVEIGNKLYKESDFTFSGTATATRTDAGTTNMGLTAGQFANKNTNFATVTFNVTDGYQTITPIDVTVTIVGEQSTDPYDGTAHTVNGYKATFSTPMYTENDFTFNGSDSATQTNVGTAPMGLNAEQFTNTNNNFANVTFDVTDGYQKITPIDVTVTITGHHDSQTYDGNEHSVSGYDVAISNPLYTEADFTFSGTAEAKRTEEGKTDMGLKAEQFTNKNANFATVTFNVTDGYMEIVPVDEVVVTITGHFDTSPYDGTEHSVNGYDVDISNPLYKEADFTFSGTAVAKRTDAGTTEMGLAEGQFANTNKNFKTVTFKVTDGYQTIDPIDITVTITGHNDTSDYDGKEHKVTGYDVQIDNPLYKESDFTFGGTAEAARTDVGTTNMGLANSQFTNNNTNFATVTFNVTDGYQTIDPIDITVTITGHNNTTNYDGEEHKVTGYDVEISNPLYKEADFTFSGTAAAARTDAGTTNMNLAAEQFTNTNTNFGTVTFNVTDGYQTIKPIDVTVTIVGHNNTTNYDGVEHEVTGYDVTISNPLYKEADFTFSGTAAAARTDAGTTNMNLAAEQFTNTNENFATVTFNVTDGYQTINPIDVTVTIIGKNNTSPYDGAAHTVTGYDATFSTPLYTEADFTFTGNATASQTNVGTANMGLAADQFTNKNGNFGTVTFNVTDGYQTITPIDVTVTITGHHDSKTYDGTEHKVTGYDVEISNPLYTEADFTFNGTAEAKRTNEGKTDMGLKAEQFVNTNTNFGTVTFNVTDGYMEIVPVDEVVVTIVGKNNTTDYDGEEHKVTGYDVTISNPLYTAEDFEFTGTAEAKRTNVGTTNMGLAADQFKNKNSNFSKVTFNVTDGYQTIEAIDVSVTITGHNNTTDYDGEEHSVSGYDVEISNPLYTAADFKFNGTAEAKRTDAGQTDMGLTAGQFENTNTNFATVTFNVTDGYQKIDPIDITVTITGHNNTTNYDGEEHSVSGYDVEISNLLYKEADIAFSGTAAAARTDAGTTNMGLASSQFSNKNNNFKTVTFNVTDGYQKIDPIDVTVVITGHNNTADYDGQEHSVSGYDVSIENKLYKESDFTFSGTAAAARTDVGTTNMGLTAGQFTNKNTNFATVTFQVTDGFQTIEPIDVTVTINGHTGTNPYDGTEYSVSGYDVTYSTPLYTAEDFTFSGTAEAKRTDAGKTMMGLTEDQFENINGNFADVTFVVTDGYQEITPINVEVTITGHFDSKTYDGTEYTVNGYDVQISNDLYKEADFTFSGKAEAKRTEEGKTMMGLAAEQFANTNDNFANVTFNVTDGYMEIVPVDEVVVTITGHKDTSDYDGEEHVVTGYDVVISNPLYKETDFTFSGNAEAKRTDAGTTNMGLAEGQFANTNKNFAKVTFEVTDGYQEISPIDITVTITGHNDTRDYDGTMHGVSGYDVSISNPLYKTTDFTFSGEAFAERKDAGQTDMGLKAEQFTNNNTNFGTVTFNVTDGYQKIDPIDMTVIITGHNDTTNYDGEEHSVSGYDVTINSSLYTKDDFVFTGKAEAARTDAGQTNMGLAADQFENKNDNFANVTFEVTDGYQKINPIDVTVTITGHNNTTAYDGAEHSVSGYDVEIGNKLYKESDFTFNGTAAAARTDAGQTDMGLASSQFTNTNNNFKTVTFNVTDGYQKITPIETVVTIVGNHNVSVFDGIEHTVTGYEATADTALYDVTKDFTFSGNDTASRTDQGITMMGLKPGDFENTNENFSKVTFNVTDGYQQITPLDKVVVTIKGHKETADYDGEAHTVTGYDVEISNPLYKEADFTFSGEATATRTHAGTTGMGLEKSMFENTNENFKDVSFVVEDGSITINPISAVVTITGHNNTTDYDGEDHTVTGYDVEIDNPLYTEADFTFSGEAKASRTDAGTTNMNLAESQFTNNNTDFESVTFKVTDGYQTINPIDITVTITGHNDTKPYDGSEHSVSGYDVKISNPLYTEEDFTFSGEAKASRTNAGKTPMGLVADQFENTNPNFGNVTFEITDGYMTIEPIEVTVTIKGHTDKADYDGEEHTVSGYDFEASSPLYTESDFAFSGEATAARTNAGTTNMGLAPEQFENTSANFKNVKFEVTDGSMTIDPIDVTVTIKGHTNSAPYDGEEHVTTGYDVTIGNDLYKETDFEFTGTDEAKRTDAGKTDMGLAADQFENKNSNFKTVTFDVTDGYQEITPIDVTVTITGHFDSVTYDATEHSVSGYDAEASNKLYDVDNDFEFSGTAEAARTDAGKTPMNLAADQFKNTNKNFATVTFNVTDGYMEIVPVDEVVVTITGHNNTATYDGKEHSVSGYDVVISNDLYKESDFTFSGTAEASQTDAGTSNMGLDPSQFTNNNPNFAKVTFEVTDGYQTIDPKNITVTITGNTATEKYTGKEQIVSGYEVEIPEGETLKPSDLTYDGKEPVAKGTDVGTYDMGLDPEKFQNSNGNYIVEFAVTDGSLEITKRDLVLESVGAEKVYDGTPLVRNNPDTDIIIGGDGVAPGDEIEFEITGSQTYVGSSPNYFDYTLTRKDTVSGNAVANFFRDLVGAAEVKAAAEAGEDTSDNYNITKEEGTLTVTDEGVDNDLVITKDHPDKTYKVGDEITFTIKVTNIYDEPRDITIEEQDDCTITGPSEFTDVAPGETVKTTAVHKVTKKDVASGEYSNTVTATIGDKSYSATDVVDTFQATGSDRSAKTGDDTNLLGVVTAMTGALAGLLALALRRRKEEEN